MENPNPIIHETAPRLEHGEQETIDADYIFELLRDINDPEYPNTLEELAVVTKEQIHFVPPYGLLVEYTPTIPHCSMATLIGLCIRIRLAQRLPHTIDVDVMVRDGTHVAEEAINKQLADKERVAAATENPHLLAVVEQCLSGVRQAGIALTVT